MRLRGFKPEITHRRRSIGHTAKQHGITFDLTLHGPKGGFSNRCGRLIQRFAHMFSSISLATAQLCQLRLI
jgi:hypothetical protein